MNYVNSINSYLKKFLKENDQNLILGEDILDPYGGAFKVTRGLSTEFPTQVFSTPISEAAITGISTGLTLKNHNVILEIMFGDFLTLTSDQIINGISKFLDLGDHRFGKYLIRCPMGAYRGYGATHSQSLESIFLNVPNLNIYSPNIFSDPYNLLDKILRKNNFSLFVEHKISYQKELVKNKYNNFDLIIDDNDEFTKIKIFDKESKFTILTYGYCTEMAVNAIQKIFLKHEIVGEVIAFKKLKNLSNNFLEVIESRKIYTLEEGAAEAGWGKYISNNIYNKFYNNLDKKIEIIGSKNQSIPSSKELEKDHLPSEENLQKIIEKNF